MTQEEIKYHAYAELGFRPHEHKYVDALFEEITAVRGLSEADNPAAKSNNYKNSWEFITALNGFLQKYALRAGERTDIKPPEMSEESVKKFEDIFYSLQMRKEKTPQYNLYDAVLCMGAAENGVRPRINRLAEIVANPDISIQNIMVLGAARKLWPLKKDGDARTFPEPIVYDILADRISERDGKTVTPEEIKAYVLSMDTKETAVEKLSAEVSSDAYFAGISWPTETDLIYALIKENKNLAKQNIVVVRTPDFPDGRRADSGRTIEYAYQENPEIFTSGAKILQISSQPFTRNQMTVAEINLPKGVNVDVVGEGIDEGKSFEARKKDAMIGWDSTARTVYAVFAKIRERENLRAIQLQNEAIKTR